MAKKSFSLFELLLVLAIISIISSILYVNNSSRDYQTDKLNHITSQLILHLQYTRHLAMIDNQFNPKEEMWFRSRWRIKFLRCRNNKGIYYTIFSDKNYKGTPNKRESIKDPLTRKWLYVSNRCEAKEDEYENILLTKKFDITSIDLSCNRSSSLGEIIFDNNGKPYYKFGYSGKDAFKYSLSEPCNLILTDKNGAISVIKIENETGFIIK
jgi:prepilin-type N-terminal cleavage/methylation domain-containing protein